MLQSTDSAPERPSREAMAALASRFDRNAVAEFIIDAMARRQGHRSGPYFNWSLATEQFRSLFDAAWAAAPHPLSSEAVEQIVRAFVAAWPEGAAALRVIPDPRDPIANPPYSRAGMWPAFLRKSE